MHREYHVYERDKENLDGFVRTRRPRESGDGGAAHKDSTNGNSNSSSADKDRDKDKDNPKVYALDCEMCYTMDGVELTRVTVIDALGEVVMETLVQPSSRVVDYNTQVRALYSRPVESFVEKALVQICQALWVEH